MQQIVAACAAEPWEEDALYEVLRRAHPYSGLRARNMKRFSACWRKASKPPAGVMGRTCCATGCMAACSPGGARGPSLFRMAARFPTPRSIP